MKQLLAVCCVLTASLTTEAQARKTPVWVAHTGKDQVGVFFVKAFERDIARSDRYEPMKGEGDGLRFYVDFITTDASDTASEQGKRSAVSVVIEDMGLPNSFPVANMWYHKAFVVDRHRADQVASELVDDIDAAWCRQLRNSPSGCPSEKLEPHRF